ncbi:MAG: FecR domain-containing protein [Kiritimatiellae bacterium]|nr:FecR domain-containing protein [Kiritimatiellia bacterium]
MNSGDDLEQPAAQEPRSSSGAGAREDQDQPLGWAAERRDQLIDGLLREELGGERPPDLADRILARAYARRRAIRFGVPAAAAAALLVAAGAVSFLVSAARYPAPSASGVFDLVGATEVGRGATLVTTREPASLRLGGYCRVELSASTTVRIGGGERTERIQLEKGAVQCAVAPGKGTFEVSTEVGTVSVIGTLFTVSLLEEEPGAGEPAPAGEAGLSLSVHVAAGRVRVTHAGGTAELGAGTHRTFRPARRVPGRSGLPAGIRGFSGRVRGVVSEKLSDDSCRFSVFRLLRTWEDNRAESPQRLVGQTVRVAPGGASDSSGEWRRDERHAAFIEKLQVRQELDLDIRHAERDTFVIRELSDEQLDSLHENRQAEPAPPPAALQPGLPEGVRGFTGRVRGTVTAKGEGNRFTFAVHHILELLNGNRASDPELLVNRTVEIGPGGEREPTANHLLFIGRLRVQQEVDLAIRHGAGDRFEILELSEGQLEWLGVRKRAEPPPPPEPPAIPEGVRGFFGMVRGEVTAHEPDDHITLRVDRVQRVWRENRASNPRSLEGRMILVGPQREGDKRAGQIAFIRRLQLGQVVELEVRHGEGRRFVIVELTRDQEQDTGQPPDKPDAAEAGDLTGIEGFKGRVHGEVLSREGDAFFSFRVAYVARVWGDSTASSPMALRGQTIRVEATRTPRGEADETQAAFIRRLEPGANQTLDIEHVERDVFRIQQLSARQTRDAERPLR